MRSRINLSAPDITALEQDAVSHAMSGGWVSTVGPELDAFEREVAERVGVAAGVAVSSGTAALHLGLLGAGVSPGSTVVTSTFTFAATANAVVHAGAQPFFVDSDPTTANMSPALLDEALSSLRAEGTSVAAVLPVDIYGHVADLPAIQEVADRYEVPVLCDSAESFGATLGGRAAGSFGRASVVSFNGNKVMTTSGGGMLLTDDVELAVLARRISSQARQPVAHYEHHEIGYNYRLSNVLAALGRAQLSRLDEMIARRHQVRARYRAALADVPGVRLLHDGIDDQDNAWLTSILLDDPSLVAQVGADLAAADIETRQLWKPLHCQPVFSRAGRLVTGESERMFRHGLTLPSGSVLTDDDVERVVEALLSSLSRTGTRR